MRFLFMFLCITTLHANEHANTLQRQAANIAKTTTPESIPGFVTGTPPEARLDNVHALEAAGESATSTSQYAKDVQEIAETRPYFVIDPKKDPIMTHAQNAAKDPEAFLQSQMHNRKPRTTFEFKKCRESKPATELTCQKSLLTPTIHIEPAKYSHFWCTSGAHPSPDDPRCRAKAYYNPARKYKEEVVSITDEKWTNTCSALQEKTRAGVCRLVRKSCPKGSETKYVKGPVGRTGKTDSRPITKPCWRYEHTYQCNHPSPNTCAVLRKSTCEQMQSNCIQKIGEECVEWEQTYRCPVDVQEDELSPVSSAGFKLPKGGTSVTYTANTDMNDAISKLSIFEEIQNEMRVSPTADSITVFKGKPRACTVAFAGFKNCCTSGSGWGMYLGLSNCNPEEKDLADSQRRGLCVRLGTYCAERVLGICTRKKRSACCFPSKISRILHEQGRSQLGLGWGSAKNPDCRGFTPEELSHIDFDQLDLSEVFAEIAARAKNITARVVQRNMSDRINDMTSGLNNAEAGPSNGGD